VSRPITYAGTRAGSGSAARRTWPVHLGPWATSYLPSIPPSAQGLVTGNHTLRNWQTALRSPQETNVSRQCPRLHAGTHDQIIINSMHLTPGVFAHLSGRSCKPMGRDVQTLVIVNSHDYYYYYCPFWTVVNRDYYLLLLKMPIVIVIVIVISKGIIVITITI